MANTRKLPDIVSMPCSFCCKSMSFDKQVFLKGGTAKCQNCGMAVVFKPHPNAGRRKAKPGAWHGSNPDSYGA